MVEGYVEDAVETTSGDIWYKARDDVDRTYYVKKGEGIIGYGTEGDARRRYAAAKSHSLSASVGERGVDPESLIDRMEMIGPRTSPTGGLEQGSLQRELGGDKNQMLGYIYAKYDEPESDEEWANAIQDFADFVEEIDDASTQQEREDIREAYGVGGS